MSQDKFTVTTARGMLPILEKELISFGIKDYRKQAGSISFTGDLEQAYRVCLWSRVAIRVLFPIAKFEATCSDSLYQGINAIEWERHIANADTTIAVDFNHFRSKIKHKQFGAQRVKDGIVDRLRTLFQARPSIDRYQPDLRVNVYLKHNQAIVSIDLSGESLHKRGYRVAATEAPLKEHLASAILLSSGWPQLAKSGGAILDPLCGTGTFLIEAAQIAADIAPGLQRLYFGFFGWHQHQPLIWQTLCAEAERRRQSGLARLRVIKGGDNDPRAIDAAKANIHAADLDAYIEVIQCDLASWQHVDADLAATGLLVCNPPYGQRIGRQQDLNQLYRDLAVLIRHSLPAWQMTIISDNAELLSQVNLPEAERYPLDNGPIKCTVSIFKAVKRIANNTSAIDEEASSNRPSAEISEPQSELRSPHSEQFANRLKKNLKHLIKWAKNNDISCYRIYDADLPEYAVAIDRYDDHIHIQEYLPPKTVDPEKSVKRLQDIVYLVPKILAIPSDQVIVKYRKKQRGIAQYEALSAQKRRFQVKESGLSFWVNLTDYLDTGLFLDHRITRQKVAELAFNKDMLNLFAYTGTASVYAAMGGARSTTTIDMSKTYLSWARDNMLINGFSGQQHQFIRTDCLSWLEGAQRETVRYDLIFLDPPTFSNSSRMSGVFDVQRDHVKVIQDCLNLLNDSGTLIFSTNRRDFKLDVEALQSLTIVDLHRQTLPVDFKRNPKIHSCWQIHKSRE